MSSQRWAQECRSRESKLTVQSGDVCISHCGPSIGADGPEAMTLAAFFWEGRRFIAAGKFLWIDVRNSFDSWWRTYGLNVSKAPRWRIPLDLSVTVSAGERPLSLKTNRNLSHSFASVCQVSMFRCCWLLFG